MLNEHHPYESLPFKYGTCSRITSHRQSGLIRKKFRLLEHFSLKLFLSRRMKIIELGYEIKKNVFKLYQKLIRLPQFGPWINSGLRPRKMKSSGELHASYLAGDDLQFSTCVQTLLPPVNLLEAIITPYINPYFLDLFESCFKDSGCTAGFVQCRYGNYP
ncbi:hypothetical protein CEXT_455061 [Caerostris extrusa]|uniref:Maturase K n=1 Tax=Caerostris extrusa TaxID=172846 RepID=A0AAV4XDB0_CAEEX|nr:hypothetical protein CEXT_455061 [Caerostris extrusa]